MLIKPKASSYYFEVNVLFLHLKKDGNGRFGFYSLSSSFLPGIFLEKGLFSSLVISWRLRKPTHFLFVDLMPPFEIGKTLVLCYNSPLLTHTYFLYRTAACWPDCRNADLEQRHNWGWSTPLHPFRAARRETWDGNAVILPFKISY